ERVGSVLRLVHSSLLLPCSARELSLPSRTGWCEVEDFVRHIPCSVSVSLGIDRQDARRPHHQEWLCYAKSACSERTFPPVSRRVMANRKLGCLTLFLFLALCASVIINVFLAIALLGRVSTGVAREEPLAKFREIVVQRGGRGVSDRIVVIVMRGLISSSIPGAASDNMVD